MHKFIITVNWSINGGPITKFFQVRGAVAHSAPSQMTPWFRRSFGFKSQSLNYTILTSLTSH
jgi:hypothetical protein